MCTQFGAMIEFSFGRCRYTRWCPSFAPFCSYGPCLWYARSTSTKPKHLDLGQSYDFQSWLRVRGYDMLDSFVATRFGGIFLHTVVAEMRNLCRCRTESGDGEGPEHVWETCKETGYPRLWNSTSKARPFYSRHIKSIHVRDASVFQHAR